MGVTGKPMQETLIYKNKGHSLAKITLFNYGNLILANANITSTSSLINYGQVSLNDNNNTISWGTLFENQATVSASTDTTIINFAQIADALTQITSGT